MTVLSLFDFTGNMVRPWAEAGYDCTIVDLQHTENGRGDDGILRIGADVRDWDWRGSRVPCSKRTNRERRWTRGPNRKTGN